MSFFPPSSCRPPPVIRNEPVPIVQKPVALTILSQDSAGTEEIKVRGMQTLLFVVIKNSPFETKLSLSRFEDGVTFLNLPLRAQLIYDEGEKLDDERQVTFIKTKPLLVKYEESEKFTIAECRIKALTSQHEDCNFRIRFTALDPNTGKVREPLLTVLSAPIKVVSKPEQLKNPRKGASYSAALKASRLSGIHVEQIKMIASSATEQLDLLQQIVKAREDRLIAAGRQDDILPDDDDLFPENYVAPVAPPVASTKRKRKKGAAPPPPTPKSQFHDPFDASFFRFYSKFSDLPRGSQAEAVRGNVKRLKNAQQESLNGFADNLRTQVLQLQSGGEGDAVGGGGTPADYCTCADCPHRAKLSTMDSFLSQ